MTAVNGIAKKRMANACHMHTNLMGPSGFKRTFNVCIFAKPMEDTVMCNRRTAVFLIDRHLFPIHRRPPDRCVDCPGVLTEIIINNRLIAARNGMFFKLLCKA